MDFIPVWADAIAQFEGFYQPGNRAARNHNPGNLKFANQTGTIGKDPDNFAVFADDNSGFQALYRQLQKYVSDFPGYSILQITAHYLGQPAPTVDQQGDAFSYASFVASKLGVDPSVTLSDLANGVTDSLSNLVFSGGPADVQSSGPQNSGPNLVYLAIGGVVIFWLISRIFGG